MKLEAPQYFKEINDTKKDEQMIIEPQASNDAKEHYDPEDLI
jgi:hypothetical protein